MMFVVAPSYSSIVYIFRCFSFKDVIIISSNCKILDFCEQINVRTMRLPKKTDSPSFEDLKEYKVKVEKIADNINGEKVFFSINIFGIWYLYLIKCLSKNNKIFFKPLDPNYEIVNFSFKLMFQQEKYLTSLKDVIIMFFLTKIYFDIFNIHNKYVLGINNESLKKRYFSLNEVKTDSIFKRNVKTINYIFKLKKNDVLIIDSPIDNCYTYPKNLMLEICENFSYLNLSVSVKKHPNFKISDELLDAFYKIPDHIPSELIDYSHYKIIIGNKSSSLIELSEYKSVISILNMTNYFNNEIKQRLINVNLEDFNNYKISSPFTMEDFKQELIKILDQ